VYQIRCMARNLAANSAARDPDGSEFRAENGAGAGAWMGLDRGLVAEFVGIRIDPAVFEISRHLDRYCVAGVASLINPSVLERSLVFRCASGMSALLRSGHWTFSHRTVWKKLMLDASRSAKSPTPPANDVLSRAEAAIGWVRLVAFVAGLLRARCSHFVSWWFPVAIWSCYHNAAWGQSHYGLVPWAAGGALMPQATEREFAAPDFTASDFVTPPRVVDRYNPGKIEAADDIAHSTGGLIPDHPPSIAAPTVQWFPDGLIYRSYLGSVREPRFACVLTYEKDQGWLWDVSLGGRVGIVRYGAGPDFWPDGWQVDMEGAAFPRLDPFGPSTPLLSTDFRFGLPVTYGSGPFRFKTGYYHLSSHLGDEFMLANPDVERSNYSRDAVILAASYYFGHCPPGQYDWRCYGEVTWADWAASRGGVAKPWEFLFGLEYSPAFEFERGTPFAAFNTHLREEANFGGHLSMQIGWQTRRGPSGALFRFGGEYVNGKSTQASFFRDHESRVGVGLWYDY
jgi:hypothetical protein